MKAAVHLARALDAAIVVEGVENEDDWERVQDLGVDMAQGYHLGRPMPLSDLIDRLAANRP